LRFHIKPLRTAYVRFFAAAISVYLRDSLTRVKPAQNAYSRKPGSTASAEMIPQNRQTKQTFIYKQFKATSRAFYFSLCTYTTEAQNALIKPFSRVWWQNIKLYGFVFRYRAFDPDTLSIAYLNTCSNVMIIK